MKLIFIFLILFVTLPVKAQLRPAQSQYLQQLGALVNPSFAQGLRGWDIGVSNTCTVSVGINIPYLNNIMDVLCLSQVLDVSQTVTSLTNFAGQQGLASFQYLSAFELTVQVLENGNVQQELTLPSTDGVYKKVELPFIIDTTSNAIAFSSASSTGAFNLGKVRLDLAPDGYVQQIDQSHFVGSVLYNETDCFWQTASSTYADFPVDADCVPSETVGNVSQPDTRIPAIKLLKVKTSGYYKIVFDGLMYSGSDTECRYTLSSSTSYENQHEVFSRNSAPTSDFNRAANGTSANMKFTTGGDKTVRVLAYRVSGSNNCELFGRDNGDLASKFTVHYFPEKTDKLASENTGLCKVEARTNDGDTITASTEDIPFKDIVKQENCAGGGWSNAGNTGANTNDAFTAPRDMRVLVTAQVLTNEITSKIFVVYVNGSSYRTLADKVGSGSNERHQNTIQVDLNEGDVLTIRNGDSGLTLSASSVSHWIQITELPSEAWIAGRFRENQSKFEFKHLTADVTSNGTVSDLAINNLVIGRYYRIFGTCDITSNAGDNVSLTYEFPSSGLNVARCEFENAAGGNSDQAQFALGTRIFQATETSLQAVVGGIVNASSKLDGGVVDETNVTIEELPQSTTETTEF